MAKPHLLCKLHGKTINRANLCMEDGEALLELFLEGGEYFAVSIAPPAAFNATLSYADDDECNQKTRTIRLKADS